MGKKEWRTKQKTVLFCFVNSCCDHTLKAVCSLGVSFSSQEGYSGPGRWFTEEHQS